MEVILCRMELISQEVTLHLGRNVSPQLVALAKELWMWCLERNSYPHHRATYARCTEHNCRHRVQESQRPVGLEVKPCPIQAVHKNFQEAIE